MPQLNSFEIYSFTTLNQIHKDYIFKIWNNEYPINLDFESLQDTENYLNSLIEAKHFFAVDENNQMRAWAVIFERDYEKWFAIIVDSELHQIGLGRKILNRLKTFSTELNGWVIDHEKDTKANGEPYRSPLAFYMKNDFNLLPETRLELDKISAVKINWRE